MSERPTPETDAAERMAFAQEYMVPTAFARKLERERDQAREGQMEALCDCQRLARKIDDIRDVFDHQDEDWTGSTTLAKAVSKVIRERDEARELCRELSDLVAYGLGQSGEPWSLDAMRQATAAIQKTKQMGTLPTD